MKKQNFTSISLKLNKTNIVNLHSIKGGGYNLSALSDCFTQSPDCIFTITIRTDSLKAVSVASN